MARLVSRNVANNLLKSQNAEKSSSKGLLFVSKGKLENTLSKNFSYVKRKRNGDEPEVLRIDDFSPEQTIDEVKDRHNLKGSQAIPEPANLRSTFY